jgi:hypothetical protein
MRSLRREEPPVRGPLASLQWLLALRNLGAAHRGGSRLARHDRVAEVRLPDTQRVIAHLCRRRRAQRHPPVPHAAGAGIGSAYVRAIVPAPVCHSGGTMLRPTCLQPTLSQTQLSALMKLLPQHTAEGHAVMVAQGSLEVGCDRWPSRDLARLRVDDRLHLAHLVEVIGVGHVRRRLSPLRVAASRRRHTEARTRLPDIPGRARSRSRQSTRVRTPNAGHTGQRAVSLTAKYSSARSC